MSTLQFDNISKHFPGVKALNGVSFEASAIARAETSPPTKRTTPSDEPVSACPQNRFQSTRSFPRVETFSQESLS